MASFLTSWFQKKSILAAKRSDSLDYQDVMNIHGAGLLRVAGVYGFQGHDREELEQEIAVAIWEALPHWNSNASLRTYLFRVAHNTCIDRIRRPKRPVLESDADTRIAPEPSPETRAIDRETLRQLQAALEDLPMLQRQTLTLNMEGLIPAEISEVLGIDSNYVHVLIHRARTTLRKEIEGKE